MTHNQALRYFRKQAALAGVPFTVENRSKHRQVVCGGREVMISHGSSPVRNLKRMRRLLGLGLRRHDR